MNKHKLTMEIISSLKITKAILGLIAVIAIVAVSGSAMAMSMHYTLDGIKDSSDSYTNSFDTGWINGHKTEYSIYDDYSDMTTVYWGIGTSPSFSEESLFLFLEVPIYAKNMIWGSGFTDAEALSYYQLWCSPSGGMPAALDGSNCQHHKDGFETFKSDKTDYGAMTGSEKAIFESIKAELTKGTSAPGSLGLLGSKNSLDYLIDNLICNTTDCSASTTTMSFEFQFELAEIDKTGFLSSLETNGIEFHLSPERRATAVPEPATFFLLGSGLVGMVMLRKRFVA